MTVEEIAPTPSGDDKRGLYAALMMHAMARNAELSRLPLELAAEKAVLIADALIEALKK